MASPSEKAAALGWDTFDRQEEGRPLDVLGHAPNFPPGIWWERLLFDGRGDSNHEPRDTLVTRLSGGGVYAAAWPLSGRGAVCRFQADPVIADYDVEAKFGVGTSPWYEQYIMGRMSPTGYGNSDRYQIYVAAGIVSLEKVVNGTLTVLDTVTGLSGQPRYRLEMRGTTIRVLHNSSAGDDNFVEVINVTDSEITQVGRAGIGAGGAGERHIDDFYLIPPISTKVGSSSADISITGAVSVAVEKDIAGTSTANISITGAVSVQATQDIISTGNIDVGITGSVSVKKMYQLFVRAGLLHDVVAGKVLTQWSVGQIIVPGGLATPMPLGSVLDFVYDTHVARKVLSITGVPSSDFESVLAAHMGMLFPSNLDMRGGLQMFASVSWEANGRPYVRASLLTPQAVYPITQDPAHMEALLTSSYRHLPVGITSWPPGTAASPRLRAGEVTHVVSDRSQDILEMNLLVLQAISTDSTSLSSLKIQDLNIIPVEDGYFSIEPVKESPQTAIQQGEAVVLDGINNPPGGYVVRRANDDGAENVNMSPPVPIHGGPLELLPNKENVIIFLAERWSGDDPAGLYGNDVQFDAWIEYEPRFLYV